MLPHQRASAPQQVHIPLTLEETQREMVKKLISTRSRSSSEILSDRRVVETLALGELFVCEKAVCCAEFAEVASG